MRRLITPLAIAALLIPASSASGAVAFDRSHRGQVLLAADDQRPRVIARDGAFPSISRHSDRLAYVRRRDGAVVLREGRRRALVRVRSRGRRRALRHIETVELSPDGRVLLVRNRYSWRAVRLSSGRAVTVTPDESREPRFTPDSEAVVWAGQNGGAFLRRVDGRGGTKRIFGDSAVDVAPFGDGVAVLHGDEGARRLTLLDPGSGASIDLPVEAADATGLGPVFEDRRLTLLVGAGGRDLARLDVVEPGGRLVRRLQPGDRILGDSAGFSDDGGTLYVIRGTTLHAVDLASGGERRLARDIGLDLSASRR